MNREKELLLKLLMEKYEDEDLDYDCGESSAGIDYSYYGGAKYEIVDPEPEVWKEYDLTGPEMEGSIGSIVLNTTFNTKTKCTGVRGSNYNNIELSFKGGDPKLIAKALWMTKPAGIGLVGDSTFVIEDGLDQEHLVSFNYEYQ